MMYKLTFKIADAALGEAYREAQKHAVGEVDVLDLNADERVTSTSESHTAGRTTPTPHPASRRAPTPKSGKGSGLPKKPVGELMPVKVAASMIAAGVDNPTPELIRVHTSKVVGHSGSYSYVVHKLKELGLMSGPDKVGVYDLDKQAFKDLVEGEVAE